MGKCAALKCLDQDQDKRCKRCWWLHMGIIHEMKTAAVLCAALRSLAAGRSGLGGKRLNHIKAEGQKTQSGTLSQACTIH
eukprot:3931285-Amphidinium_carterae.1